MFLLSFLPLYVILLIKGSLESIKNIKEYNFYNFSTALYKLILSNVFWSTIFVMIVIPIISIVFIFLKSRKRIIHVKVSSQEKIGDNIVSYVMTYIVPLTSLSYSSSFSEYISNVLLFIIIMILYIRMDLIYLNPVLIIINFNIFKINEGPSEKFVLTRLSFSQFTSKTKSDTVYFNKLSNSLYYLPK